MTVAPVLDAETILAVAIRDALAPYVETHNGRPRCYYQLAEQGAPLPYLVYQLQADITPVWRLGLAGASALVTVRALAASAQAARALLRGATPGLADLIYPDYDITARYVRSPSIPPQNGVYQSAHIWRVSIERS